MEDSSKPAEPSLEEKVKKCSESDNIVVELLIKEKKFSLRKLSMIPIKKILYGQILEYHKDEIFFAQGFENNGTKPTKYAGFKIYPSSIILDVIPLKGNKYKKR